MLVRIMGLRFMVFSLPHSGSTLPCLPDTAGLVAPPPPHGCCCWATAAWCCGCELPVSAGLLLAMLPRQEGGREEGEAQARSRSSGQRSRTYSMEGRRAGEPAALCPSRAWDCNWDADTRTPSPGRTANSSREDAGRKGQRRAREHEIGRAHV